MKVMMATLGSSMSELELRFLIGSETSATDRLYHCFNGGRSEVK